jgi:hypothetical protein
MAADTTTSQTQALIQELRATRAETIRRFAPLDPARLTEPREWRGERADLRHLLASLTEGSESRRIQILGIGRQLGRRRMTDAQHAMGIKGETRGRLLGTLIGVPDAFFDRAPADGEWSIRQVLGHVMAVDERYRIGVEYAVERARRGSEGPLRPPEDSMPPRKGEAMAVGAVPELMARMQSIHDRVVDSLMTVPDDLLDAPANWASWDVDVRFRAHRFAAHDREHTIQIRKTLQALGFVPTEPQLLLADAQAALGALEITLLGIGDELLDRPPAAGGPTIRQLVQELLTDEHWTSGAGQL